MTRAATAALPMPGMRCANDSGWHTTLGDQILRRSCVLSIGHEGECRWSGWTPTGETVTEDPDTELDF